MTARRYLEHEIESASPVDVDAVQWAGVVEFLRAHVASNPFHRARAEASGVHLDAVQTRGDFEALPLMRKEDVTRDAAAHPPFGRLTTQALQEIAQFAETSGTSGRGAERYLLSRRDQVGLDRLESFGFAWAGVEPGKFVATTFPVTTRAAGRWHQSAVERLGGIYLPLGAYDTSRKLEYLESLPIHTLIASPSYLVRLEAEAETQGIDVRSFGVAALVTGGESFTSSWVETRQGKWGARVFEQYGSTQRAFAWSCEFGASRDGRPGLLHTLPHLAYYEVIDPNTGRAVGFGEHGELVITPFSCSEAAPLVRYATGDRVRWLPATDCSCGRPFPGFEAGNVRRFDDMIKVKGVNLYPQDVDAILLVPPVVDYQASVEIDERGRERITILIEYGPSHDTRPSLSLLQKALHESIGLRVEVAEHRGPPLTPESSAGAAKRRRWRDLRIKS